MKVRPIFTPRGVRQLYLELFLAYKKDWVKYRFGLFALVLAGLPLGPGVPSSVLGEEIEETKDERFERQKKNWADFLEQLNGLQEAFVREPSRPLVQWRQEILKLHYLWLEVRDYAFVKYAAEKREKLDAYVSHLVARVEAQNDLAARRRQEN